MADISKITTLDGVTYELKDNVARQAIPFGIVDSTSTSKAYTATVPGITSLSNGTCVLLKNGVVTSESGFTININGLGAKKAYSNMAAASAETTIFNIDYTMLFVFDETRVSGGGWICYRGYNSNTDTIGYQLRTNSGSRTASDTGYRYRLWFSSADDTQWVPANTSSSTNATSSRTTNTRPINPFGPIVYRAQNSTQSAGGTLPATVLWQQYAVVLGYSFNTTGTALTLSYPASVYLKCSPQTDGSAVMVEYTQALPVSKDGFIYIYLGQAYNATTIELRTEHPVYWYDGTGLRIWTGKEYTDTHYTADTSKLVTTTVPNVTNVGSTPTLGTAISADDITAWTTNTPTSITVSGEKLIITPGTAATLSYTEKSIPNVTSVGSVPTLGTAITVATGSLSSSGTGSTVATGISTA